MSTLYYGDNLDVLKRHIRDESVDLIYLDPPFQSGRDYNVLFKEQDGTKAAAQIRWSSNAITASSAYRTSWHRPLRRGRATFSNHSSST